MNNHCHLNVFQTLFLSLEPLALTGGQVPLRKYQEVIASAYNHCFDSSFKGPEPICESFHP